MVSKFDRLREGQAVEFEPGVYGRLNKENKKLELSTGEVLDVSGDPDFFPQDERALNLSRRKEGLEKKASGFGGEFIHQYTSQGIPGAARDWYNFATEKGEDYILHKQAQNEVSNRISKESPWISAGATAANIATDIAATRGMSALVAAPTLAVGHAGPRVLENPLEVGAEALTSAAGGYLIDKGAKAINAVKNRRAQIQNLPIEQQAIKQQNLAGKAAVDEANAIKQQQHNILTSNVKQINKENLERYNFDMNARENRMIDARNAYNESLALGKAANEFEKKRLADEFNFAKKQYEESVKNLPIQKAKAQKEYSDNVIKNSEKISKAFPQKSKIYSSQLGVNDFIEESINKTGLAGTREGNAASKIIKSIFPEGEILSANQISSRYRAMEDAIQRANPEVKGVLNTFKEYFGNKLTPILADNISYAKVIPAIRSKLQKEVYRVLDDMPLAETGIISRPFLKKKVEQNINTIFREVTPENFAQKMQSGEIRDKILKQIINPKDFESSLSLLSGKKPLKISSEEAQKLGINLPNPAQQKYDEFINGFGSRLDNIIAQQDLKIFVNEIDAAKKMGGSVKKTLGIAEELPTPIPPIKQVFAPQALPSPPGQLPIPPKPSTISMSEKFTPQNFTPTQMPELPVATNMAERTGDLLEKNLLGGRGLVNNPLTKLAGLKYVLGKGALPLEAAYVGAKTLTSPGAVGEVSRATYKQGGIQAINGWLEKYPSYNNGILESPIDRRSVTKEIEDDPEIPIEQKAIIQSKINRGKQLNQKL